MTDDEMMQALREFRPAKASSDEETRQNVYVYATRDVDGRTSSSRGRSWARLFPAKSPARLVAAVGVAAFAAVAAIVAAGTFAGGAAPTTRHPVSATGSQPAGPMVVTYSPPAWALSSNC